MTVAKDLILICISCFPLGSVAASMTSLDSHGMPSFASFAQQHERTYTVGSDEYEMRNNLYERSLQKVVHQNGNPHRLWDATINYLSDYSDSEFSQLLGLRPIRSAGNGARSPGVVGAHSSGMFLAQLKSTDLPLNKSWNHLESLKVQHNQGGCGSCWAIATSVMLNANAEAYGHPRTFSAQELVDCTPNPFDCGGSGGCSGSTIELGMNWVLSKGLDTDTGTPYKGVDRKCKKSNAVGGREAAVTDAASPEFLEKATGAAKPTAFNYNYDKNALEDMTAVGLHAASNDSPALSLGLTGFTRLPENEYEPLMRAIAETGPTAVSVDAGSWGNYGGGIFDGCHVDATINHAVLLQGYGFESKTGKQVKYWDIKNSWGAGFGEKGNIRLLREEGKVHCGTDNTPSEGTGCNGGPASVPVCGMCGILYDNVVPHFAKI